MIHYFRTVKWLSALTLSLLDAPLMGTPFIQSVENERGQVWQKGQLAPLQVRVGERLIIKGSGFGSRFEDRYGKVLFGNTRALERDLNMFEGAVKALQQIFYERNFVFDRWPKDVLEWSDTQVVVQVPQTAFQGPLVIQLQPLLEPIQTLLSSGYESPLEVIDPLTERILDRQFLHSFHNISRLGPPEQTLMVPLEVTNVAEQAQFDLGEAIFWSFDFNLGLVHEIRGLNWTKILAGKATDPTTGRWADPEKLFGAIPARIGEVPEAALSHIYFNPYPAPMPIRPLLKKPLEKGYSFSTGYVGYRAVESIHPVSQVKGKWVGFSCVSCHGQTITYESERGDKITRVFPGLPNQNWSMKWAALGQMEGVKTQEPDAAGNKVAVDKTRLLFAVPWGTGEHSIVRTFGDPSHLANDGLFSPIAIPMITRHTPVRRALSHAETIAGFEGSYIHAQEPDGGIGALTAHSLAALTAYMSKLDSENELLRRLGVYRGVKAQNRMDLVDQEREGKFLSQQMSHYPKLSQALARGKASFDSSCVRCHQPNFGTWTDENMMPLREVGSFFSPTIFHLKHESMRTAILGNMFWLEKRGLLHDGHVKSVGDLVHPDRCDSQSELYRNYYTIHANSFKIPKGTKAQERATRRQAYFVDVPWDKENLYWDYQQMRRSFGPRELGYPVAQPLPETPHPWCLADSDESDDLTLYLYSL